MKTLPSKTPPNNCPEFAARRETINCFFHPRLAPSTFYALAASSLGSISRSSHANGATTSCKVPGSPTSNSISLSSDSWRALPSS